MYSTVIYRTNLLLMIWQLLPRKKCHFNIHLWFNFYCCIPRSMIWYMYTFVGNVYRYLEKWTILYNCLPSATGLPGGKWQNIYFRSFFSIWSYWIIFDRSKDGGVAWNLNIESSGDILNGIIENRYWLIPPICNVYHLKWISMQMLSFVIFFISVLKYNPGFGENVHCCTANASY
jgi:hypothetical protein